VIGKAARERDETGFVRDAQQGSWHIGESPVSSPADAGRAWRRKGKAAETRPFFWSLILFNDAVSRHST